MRVRVLEPAAADLEVIHAYIARGNPRAADSFVHSMRAHIRRIAETGFGEVGRPGRRLGTRELVHGRFVIVDRVDGRAGEILVLSIVRGASRR